jgi:hypothetical protein
MGCCVAIAGVIAAVLAVGRFLGLRQAADPRAWRLTHAQTREPSRD